MALVLLFVGIILMEGLKIQAQDSLPTFTPTPPLRKFPLMPDFQYEQFQGKWYSVGWAQNTTKNENVSDIVLHSIIYELNDDYSYNVTSEWLSPEECEQRFEVIIPTDQPGVFTLDNITFHDGLCNFTLRVLETDYNQFALVSLETIVHDNVYFDHVLYGRTKNLRRKVKEYYYNVSKSLGFPEEYIVFTDPWVECVDY